MPIYEYSCKRCGHEWEEMQKITDGPLTHCPDCGKKGARRLISRTSFMLKGNGWYATDYGRGTGGSAGEVSKSSSKAKETKDSSSSSSSSSKSSSSDD